MNRKQQRCATRKDQSRPKRVSKPGEHLPEWRALFGDLKEEAEERYPDGRINVIIPGDEADPDTSDRQPTMEDVGKQASEG